MLLFIDYLFEINTPTINSQKFWITNGAYYANYSVVFAQTYIPAKDGKMSHEGINAFLVQLRDKNNNLLPGIVIDDMGSKMGMNGVDNARIKLTKVLVDRRFLLDNITILSQISPNAFEMISSKEVKSKRERFLATSNRLLSGRLCLSCICLSEAKIDLIVLSNYAKIRLSNGRKGISDTPINEYQLYQNQIIPLIVRTLILNVGLNYVRNVYSKFIVAKAKSNNFVVNQSDFNQIVRLCCVVKPLLAWHANNVANIARERAGGQGYLSIDRLESGIGTAHAAITAEGDSAVLMQKVSKEYVDDYSKNKLATNVLPKLKSASSIQELKSAVKSSKSIISNLQILLDLVKARELILLSNLSMKNLQYSKTREDIYELWMMQASNEIQELAESFGERIFAEQFLESFIPSLTDSKGNNETTINKMELCLKLFIYCYLNKYLSFYILENLISIDQAKTLKEEKNGLIKEVNVFSRELLDGFGVPREMVIAPIANDYKEYYNCNSTNGEFSFMKKKINELKKRYDLKPKF